MMPPAPKSKRSAIYVIGPSIAYTPLTKGFYCLVDREDAETIQRWCWYADITEDGYTYARRDETINGRKKRVRMHTQILGNGSFAVRGDHISGNTLDCRKSNLRLSSASQNGANSRNRKNNTSGYKGVFRIKKTGRFMAYIMNNYKRIVIGYFATAEEAFSAYCVKAQELYGEFARFA